jgi:hypothetical protein
MATTSFKKEFIVKDREAVDRFARDLDSKKPTVSYTKKDFNSDKNKGNQLLARLVSA